jgi:hypothetical protein
VRGESAKHPIAVGRVPYRDTGAGKPLVGAAWPWLARPSVHAADSVGKYLLFTGRCEPTPTTVACRFALRMSMHSVIYKILGFLTPAR